MTSETVSSTHPIPEDQSFGSVTDQIAGIPLHYPYRRNWWILFGLSGAGVLLLAVSVLWLFVFGVGVWVVNIPVNWGLAVSDYVWWIGLGSPGTLCSARLLLLQQAASNSLNRFAEAMTMFAVICAGMMPILHMGRPQFFYWMFPYPNTMQV